MSLAALATERAAAISAECADDLAASTNVEAAPLNGCAQPSPKLDKTRPSYIRSRPTLRWQKGS